MKIRTSIAIDQALLQKAVKLSHRHRNRSELLEAALRAYVARAVRRNKEAKDLETINRRAVELNQEALDVLAYQVTL